MTINQRTRVNQIIGVLLLLMAWETNSQMALFKYFAPTLPSTFFPSVSAIGTTVISSVLSPDYQAACMLSVWRTILAFVVAALSGVLAALLSARFAALDNLTYFPVEFLRQIPAVAILPFAIILFGIDTPMKVAVAIFGSFFPVYIATREGLANVDHRLMLTARKYGWSGARLVFGVMLPAAVPHILAALRITLAICLILVIMSEMLVGGDGLGIRLVERERTFDFPGLYAETLLLGVVGVAINQILLLGIRRLHYWRDESSWTSSSGRQTVS